MKTLSFFIIALTIVSCTTSSESTEKNEKKNEILSVINPPFEGNFINDTIFKINPKIDNEVHTPNGSSIFIPANCIVNDEGEDVEEDVELVFNQYHSILDIMTSGIPMEYDTLGKKYTFESAGMFDLKAKDKNGEFLKVKEGEKLKVNLASDKNDEKFNFYQLDEQTGEWSYKKNKQKVAKNENYKPIKKLFKPKQAKEDAFVLDFDFAFSDYKELSIFNSIVWEYTGTNDSLDPRKNSIGKTRWTKFDLAPTNEAAYEYFLTMSHSKKSFTTRVKALLSGDDFEIALQTFNDAKIEIENKIESLQKPFIRSVNIAGFGTYNYDYLYHIESPVRILADFEFDSKTDKAHALVVVVYKEQDVIVNYPQNIWGEFGLDTKADAKIIAILPNNKLAVYKGNVAASCSKKEFTYKMNVLNTTVQSKVDILKAIQDI